MDEAKITELRSINRELARFLGQQHETMLGYSIVISALQRTIQGDPALSKTYAGHLKALQADEYARPNPMQAGLVTALLAKMKNW